MTAQDKTLAAALSAPTQAACAKILGVSGKGFRDVTRNVFGVHVSRDADGAGVAWERVRAYRVAYHNASGDARKAIVAAYKEGKPLPQ